MQIVREDKSDFHMQENALKILQLITEIFMTTFFVSIVTFYLLLELITYYSISAINLELRHVRQVTVMNKDILHVYQIEFIFSVFDTDSDFITKLQTQHVIQHYEHDVNVKKLIVAQQNKIDIILII